MFRPDQGLEESDWLKRLAQALEDLALSLPPGRDRRAYLEERPEMPLAQAVLSAAPGGSDWTLVDDSGRSGQWLDLGPHRVDTSP